MKKWLFYLAIVAIIYNWGAISDRLFPTKFSPLARQGEIVLYSAKWCGYCGPTRELLKRQGVKFVEYDIDQSAVGRRYYLDLGGGGVPKLEVGRQLIRGYDEKRILAAIKKYRSEHP